jgi:RNA polymerase sigma-70 factor, ECF subfamily
VRDGCELELLRWARAGDRAAFDRLRAVLEAPLRRFVHRLIGPSEAVEDVVQDAFVALYVNLERIEPVENLRPFLYRIVRNRCYDELRRNGRFQVLSLHHDGSEATGSSPLLIDQRPGPDEVTQRVLLYAQIQQAMERLPEVQRQALIFYGEEEMSYAEIAEVMATDIGTVKSRIHYARKTLVRLLTPETREALGIGRNENAAKPRKGDTDGRDGR